MTHRLSARPSASSTVASTQSPTRKRKPSFWKSGRTLPGQQVILTPCAWIHASCTTPWRPSGKRGTGPWMVTSGQSGKKWSSGTDGCQRRLAFISGESSELQREDVDHRSRRQRCSSCVSPDSATQWLPGTCHPRRLLAIPSLWILREIDASNATLQCVSLSSAAAHLLLPPTKSGCAGQGTTRCACASSLAALCLVHVLRAQHCCAAEFARTTGKSLSTAPSFPAPSGNVAYKVQVSSTVRQVASILGMPLDTPTGPHRHFGHTFRATGATYLASCGIDVWRIQLHGCWGPGAVRRCVRLSPLAPSLSLQASVGRELEALQNQILAAKAKLSFLL